MFALQAKAAFMNSISASKLNCSDIIFYCYCHRLLVVVSYSPFYFYGVYCLSSAFSFLILLVWVLSLFLLMSLAKGLLILFIFSKNQLLASLIFYMLVFISLISLLIFMLSFPLLTLELVCSFLSSPVKCKVRLFIWDFSCFLR